MPILTHVEGGKARMVDVGAKPVTRRQAVALGEVVLLPATLKLLKERKLAKGDALAAARIAGILAAKRVDSLIPLCHSLALDCVDVSFSLGKDRVHIRASAQTHSKTGVEMEALTAVSVAALTIYDMCKSADREMVIGPIFLAQKSGGKSDYVR